MISAFGPDAERFASGISGVDAIVADPGHLLPAYVEAVRRRSAGESFYGMLLLEDARDRSIRRLAPAVLAQSQDPDFQRSTLNGFITGGVTINGKPAREWLDEPDLPDFTLQNAAREFLLLCPALLVRSSCEYRRVSKLTKRLRPYALIVAEPVLPVAQRRLPARPSIVIWAPECASAAVTVHAFALAELHADVTLVSADGSVPAGAAVTAYRYGDRRIAAALAGAACVLVPDAVDPGAAIAFARLGYGVAAPLASGADEFVDNLQAYDLATPRQIHVAVTMALGRPSSVRTLPAAPPHAPAIPRLPVVPADTPPATIVVPTFNRRDDLARCLAGIGAQTYPNMRAVVVNDAGEPIDDVVARFPFAILRNLEQNVGVGQACMEGLKLVDDGFVVFLSDDDCLYPDHIQLVAGAMLRSGAAFGHSNTLIRYVQRTADGDFTTTGFNGNTFNDTATPAEAMVATPITGQSVLWRTSVFDEIGGWLVESMLSDQEIQMRAGQRFSLVYVDQTTCEWRVHGDNFSGKVNAAEEQRRLYEVVHPAPDRSWLTKTREHVLGEMARRPPGYVFGPSVLLTAEVP